MKILVVDDEDVIVKGIKFNLQNDGYEVVTGSDGRQAVALAHDPEVKLIVLDVMMPEIDGLEACRQIREFSDVPIIMLTARTQDMDKLMGFEHGADDYLTKPFNILELKARIRALLRRSTAAGTPEKDEYCCGTLRVDLAKHLVSVSDSPVSLTQKEFELLCLLLKNRGNVLSRSQILDRVWGYAFDGESRTVDVHIRTLRQKLGAAGNYIETVRGYGYRIGGEDDPT